MERREFFKKIKRGWQMIEKVLTLSITGYWFALVGSTAGTPAWSLSESGIEFVWGAPCGSLDTGL